MQQNLINPVLHFVKNVIFAQEGYPAVFAEVAGQAYRAAPSCHPNIHQLEFLQSKARFGWLRKLLALCEYPLSQSPLQCLNNGGGSDARE